MSAELELPNGEVVTAEDVFLYGNYPYRVRFPDDAPETDEDASPEFELSPLHWGGGEMDVPFRDRAALVDQWGADSRGTLSPEEWREWLREVRGDDRFTDDELDALADELPTGDRGQPTGAGGLSADDGLLARLRRMLGR